MRRIMLFRRIIHPYYNSEKHLKSFAYQIIFPKDTNVNFITKMINKSHQ